MPIHHFSHDPHTDKFNFETTQLPGEILQEEYVGNLLGQPFVKGHTPSVALLVPSRPDSSYERGRKIFDGPIPAEVPSDFRSNEQSKNAYLKLIQDRMVSYMSQNHHGPYYANFCHDGIYIFFARTRERDAFMKAMNGAFAYIEGSDEANLEVAKGRVRAGFKPQTASLGVDYAHVARHHMGQEASLPEGIDATSIFNATHYPEFKAPVIKRRAQNNQATPVPVI